MTICELVILGTGGQQPTRQRNQNSYLLQWNEHGLLFDPGEGTVRQMTLMGLNSKAITRIFISHFHHDHCMGLPGLLARMTREEPERSIEIIYPETGEVFLDHLLAATSHRNMVKVVKRPLPLRENELQLGELRVVAMPVEHTIDSLGFRVMEESGAFDQDTGRAEPSTTFAFIMDTKPCDTWVRLAEGANLVLSAASYLSTHKELAHERCHMTAAQAAELAGKAGVHRLLLTHFSERYAEINAFMHEARTVFSSADVARDLTRVALTSRRTEEAASPTRT